MAYAVVLAGGNGARLWPRVRERLPKHLMIYAGKTLLVQTLERANALVGRGNVYITTTANLGDAIASSLPTDLMPQVYTEPAVRDTGPAVGLMAARIAVREPEAVIVFLPADHVILDQAEFIRVLETALKVGSTTDGLVIIGIPPDAARTCYGYIKRGRTLYVEDGLPVYKVERFREKPNSQRAGKYVKQDEYLWNSGIVVGRAGQILDLLAYHNPKLRPGLERIVAALGRPDESEVIREAYTAFERIAFDYAVLEKTAKLQMVAGNFGWEDIGSWSSLAKVSAKDSEENVFTGRAIYIDTNNCFIAAQDKLVAAIGISDLVVIDTEDVLFLCRKDRDQEVKSLLEKVRQAGWDDYL